jgi:hypothetical protein
MPRLVAGIALVYLILLVARLLQQRVTAAQDRDLGVAPRKNRHLTDSVKNASR